MTFFIKITHGTVSHIDAADVAELCSKVRERHGHCYFKVTAVVGGPIPKNRLLVA